MAYRHSHIVKRKTQTQNSAKVSPLPMFIVLFLLAVAVRTTGVLSDDIITNSKHIEKTLLAMALVGLGAGVNIKKLRLLGMRPLMLGVFSWALVVATSYFTIRLIPLDL
jgi:uncharacterized membrane protein YadS